MVNPVFGCIQGQGEVLDIVPANVVAKLKEYGQARSRKQSVRQPWEDVKVGNVFGHCDAI
jgi:hypothetical protein